MAGLRATKHPLVRDFIRDNKKRIGEMLEGYSSPLHIIFPQVLVDNIDRFRTVISSHGLDVGVFYSCKANKSNAFIETACYKGIGVEVSSYYELKDALSRGVLGPKIICGGPSKTPRYLFLALTCCATISVDSRSELSQIIQLCKSSGLHAATLLRIGNVVHASRFGIDVPIDSQMLNLIARNRHVVEIMGFSGHLNNFKVEDRLRLVTTFTDLCKQFRELGYVNCNTVDIGGGLTAIYTTEEEWRNYEKRREEFWNNRSFTRSYPYYYKLGGTEGLKHILEHNEGGKPLYELMKIGGFRLVVELGESLLDQAGITVMRVTDVKALRQGRLIVVDGNMNHMSERLYNEDFPVSPELISSSKRGAPFEGFVAGNSCMEEDIITWHKICLPKTPTLGELLVYYNTAAYLMDSNESEFTRMPFPQKVCVLRDRNEWKAYGDESFSQVDLLRISE